MKAKKIIALVLVAVSVLACTACTTTDVNVHLDLTPESVANLLNNIANGSGNGSSSGNYTPAPTNPSVTPEPTQPQATEPSGGETPTQPSGGQTTTPPASNNGVPSTKAEIVKLYCDAYNKMAEAKTITRTYDYTSNYNNIVNVNNNDTLKGLAQTLMTQFMVENKEPLTVTLAEIAPVGSTTINIDPNLISKATCTDKGTYYEVVIYSNGTDDKYEIDSAPVTGSAGSFAPLLRADDVSGAAGSLIKFEGLHSWYATATATAKIDKATGRMTDLEFKSPCILHFDQVTAAIVVKIQNCEVGLLFHQIFKAEY